MAARDRAWIAWAGVAPDLDGAGLLVDWVGHLAGAAPTSHYETWHHVLGHGCVAAIVFAACAYAGARNRGKTALLALISFHLHLLCDLVGSRGSSPLDIWTIPYFSPFAAHPVLEWSGQWPLTSWQNTSITMLLMVIACALAPRRGYSPLSLFNRRADAAFVAVLRRRFGDSSREG